MRYKIIVNIPGEEGTTEVLVSQEQLDALESDIYAKRFVKIDGSYFNTTYIAKIVPDTEAIAIEKSDQPAIEQYSGETKKEQRTEGMNRLKDILKDKKIVSPQ